MKFCFSLLLMLAAMAGFSQSQSRLQVVEDSVRIANAELVIRNNTRNIGGYLYNMGNGKTQFIELGKSVQFNVGAESYPQGGDTAYTNISFIGRNIKVWRNGLFQYRSPNQGIKVDSVIGKIVFYPALVGGDKIYVEALYGVNLIADMTETVPQFTTNLSKLIAGISENGQQFTLRWTTNNKTLTDSPRVVGLGSSTLAGQGLSSPNRLGDKIGVWLSTNSVNPYWNNLAVSGYSSVNLLPVANGGTTATNIEAALSYNPDFIFISLPSNDAVNGLSVNQSMSNYRQIDQLAADKGVVVFWGTTQPRNTTVPVQQNLKDLADSIRAAWPDRYVESFIDLFDVTAGTPAAANPLYLQSDGIHFTTEGNQYVANRLFTRWIAYFKPIEGVRNYLIQTSSDSLNWTDFQVIMDPSQVKKTFTRTNGNKAYFRVRATYTNDATTAYSNVALLPALPVGDTSWTQAKRVLLEFGGDGTSLPSGKAVPGVDSLGKYWNNWIGLPGQGFRTGAEKQGLVTTTNESTGLSFKLIGDPSGTFGNAAAVWAINYNGFTVGVGDYPYQALYDNMFVHYSQTALGGTVLRVKGLQKNAMYRLKIWGARIDVPTTTQPRILEAKLSTQSTWKSFNGRYTEGDAPDYDRALVLDSITGVDSVDINLRASITNGVGHISLMDIKMLNFQPVLQTGVEYSDMNVTLPTSSVQPTGTIIIPGTVSYYSWGQVSGPTLAVITNGSSASPTISGLTNGEYVFRVLVNFTNGQQATDNMKVTVYPDNAGKKTSRFHFSAAAAPYIPGWVNVYGAPNSMKISVDDPVTGWRVLSDTIGTSFWKPLSSGNSSQDGSGETTGNNSGAVPDIALLNYWYVSERVHNETNPRYNLEISGLDSAKRYTIKIMGSRSKTSATPRVSAYYLKGDPAKYRQNSWGNTDTLVVITNVAPDPVNKKIYIDVATSLPSPYADGAFSYLNAMIIQEED